MILFENHKFLRQIVVHKSINMIVMSKHK